MIKINDIILNKENFPDNTQLIKINPSIFKMPINIIWKYENDSELFTIICLKKHFDNAFPALKSIVLSLVYMPNARQDRVKNDEDVFTLKYFCEIINYLNFNQVNVFDPHSNVSIALLNNVNIIKAEQYIQKAVHYINNPDLVYFFPDEGASKRYALSDKPSTYANKKRDWATGKIQGLQIVDPEVVKDKPVLIVDDICSRGGTFYYSVKELRKYTDKPIYLYISHCEETVIYGDLYKEGLVDKIFTTDMLGNLEELDDKNMIEFID